MSDNFFAVTGAMGAGKTTVLAGLVDRFPIMAEPGREVLAEARARGELTEVEADSELFVQRLLDKSIAKHRQASAQQGPYLFDRALPDCVAYARYLGTDPSPSTDAARRHRYHQRVLVFTPWPEIYTTDGDRIMPFEAAARFHALVVAAYEELGYSLVEVPRGPIAKRSAFIDGFVETAGYEVT